MSRFTSAGKKIVAVGRNYAAHAAELGNKVPTQPLLFFKPTSAYITEGQKIKFPEGCESLHHEVELGIVIGRRASHVTAADSDQYVSGYVLALDMTARDFQEKAKKAGTPWLLAKGFDTSCPVSGFIEKQKIPDPHSLNLWLKVNGEMKQEGSTADFIFTIPVLLEYITKYVCLEEGDVVLTGTPEGVGSVSHGDLIEAGLEGVVQMKFEVE